MVRLGLALLLALGCHVVLFMVILPEKQEYIPALRGRQQVIVSIRQEVHPAERGPEMHDEVEPDPEVKKEFERTPLPEKEVRQSIEPEPEKIEEPAHKELPALKPAVRKKEFQEEPVQSRETSPPEAVEPVTVLSQKGDKGPGAQPVQRQADGGSSLAEETEVIGEAVPLAEKNIPPDYPRLARKRGWEGTVMLEVDVKSDGQVRSVHIKSSSTYPLLDDAALSAVRKWHFVPGTKNGQPVTMKVQVPVHFVLKEQE